MSVSERNEVDLRALAIDRGKRATAPVLGRGYVVTRYILPALLLMGFFLLVVWAAWDFISPPKPVTVVPVFATTAETRQAGTPLFKAAGWIEPRPTPVRVAALAPGVVEELLVVEDQPVSRGDPIAELVKQDAELAYQRALADVALRKAELAEVSATLAAAKIRFEQPVHLKASLGEADAALAKVETELTNVPFALRRAVAEYVAMKNDYDGKVTAAGVVAGVQVDLARGKMDVAQALVDELHDREQSLRKEQTALLQRRDALRKQLELLTEETQAKQESQAKIQAAQARVRQAEVVVAEAKLQLDRMTVVAPLDGRVFRLIAHPGARIGSGMTQMEGHDGSTIVTLYRPESLQVRVDVRFEDIPKVQLKQPVEIDNPALSTPLTGDVLFIGSEADIQKNTLQVKVAIPNPPPVFKPEMLVDVTFLAPESLDTAQPREELKLYIPRRYVQQGESGPFVWVANQATARAQPVSIQLGASGPQGLIEVTDGLSISSRVIASGFAVLRPGDRIRVLGEEPEMQNAGASGGQERMQNVAD